MEEKNQILLNFDKKRLDFFILQKSYRLIKKTVMSTNSQEKLENAEILVDLKKNMTPGILSLFFL